MSNATYQYHRFLDEAGDTTFFGKDGVPILGNNGVSKAFILGMLQVNEPLENVRLQVKELQQAIARDPYYVAVPSINKRKAKTGYFLHAKDDVPEVRKAMYELIKGVDCCFEAVVARKEYNRYIKQHDRKPTKFYSDLLSHLLKDKLEQHNKLVLNVAERGSCTRHNNLNDALSRATNRFEQQYPNKAHDCRVVFNVQSQTNEPLLNIADYFCWAIQRVFERGETRYYDFIKEKCTLIIDLYDEPGSAENANYYDIGNPLTEVNRLK